MVKSLSPSKRAQIVALHEVAHHSIKKIAVSFNISRNAVRRALRNKAEMNSYKDRPGRGRKRASTDRQDRSLARMSLGNRRLTAPQLATMWPEVGGPQVTRKTVSNRLNEQGLRGCVAARKPWISEQNRRRRLQFARQHLHWTENEWSKVMWSDESQFCFRGDSGNRTFVRRRVGERLKLECMKGTVKHGGGNVMVWGAMCSQGVGYFVHIDEIMTGEVYRLILDANLLPSAEFLMHGQESWIFQQDNDPKHTSRTAQQWLRENQVTAMDWPPQSPDLNPIENLWDLLDRKRNEIHARNAAQLFQILTDAWASILPEDCQKLINSMPRRLQAVIDANGGPINY